MRKVIKYDGTKTYMYPSCKIATPEVVTQDFPAWKMFTHCIVTDDAEETIYSFMSLSSLRTQYNIDSSLSEADAIAAIQDAMNAPAPEPEEPEASAEDVTASSLASIAASLEYQNLLTLDDSTTTDKEDN